MFFFFQAEDGIRDGHVTGVQTCALPICPLSRAIVSSEGAKLLEWTLKYRGEKPMVAIGEFGPAGLLVSSGEIGRASCRERVLMSGGGVCRAGKRLGRELLVTVCRE